MAFEVDNYLDRQFNWQSYNCWHFANEVWKDLCGKELLATSADQAQGAYRVLHQAVSPCLVLFQGVAPVPHVGVYYQGRVLHLREEGARYEQLHLARIGFHTVTFYASR